MFFFEGLLYRISKSTYYNNFIFKGGFLLEMILGVETRTTIDIDFKVTNINITKEELKIVFRDICGVKAEDNIEYEILEIKDILKNKKYGGASIKVKAKFYNVKKL